MPNMNFEKTPMNVQDPNVRSKNFEEVSLGYNEQEAVEEANRCLNCKNKPCSKACPISIKIPDFISKIREKDFEKAYEIISKSSIFPAICGRVCPQETQCEGSCVRNIKGESVAIGRLERFVADWHRNNDAGKGQKNNNIEVAKKNNKKVAIVGSGPAGLACAADLAKLGCCVTIFEALHVAGGVLTYGIPEFRLPKKIVEKEIENLKNIGVEIRTNVVIGSTLTVEDLFEDGFEAVFIASGAGLPRFLNIEGENLNGIYSANEFLTRVNLMKAYREDSKTPIHRAKKVAVVGGGNVAMDAARCAKRLGAEKVYVIYRRSEKEMPARLEEIEHAKEEGIEFKTLCNPVKFCGNDNNFVEKICCVQMELTQPDETGRRRPKQKPNSEFSIEADCVVISVGTFPNPLIKNSTKGLEVNEHGGIIVNEKTCRTSLKKIYAGGDAVTGSATVILAMEAGKTAAKSIAKQLDLNFENGS